jgi:hypothetical protein
MGDMHDGAVLDVGLRAHLDTVHVPAQHGRRPDRHGGVEAHVTNHHRLVVNPGRAGHLRGNALIGLDHRDTPGLRSG